MSGIWCWLLAGTLAHGLSMWTGLPLVMAASDFPHEAQGSKGTWPREPGRSYCLLWASQGVTYHHFKPQACSDSGGRNKLHLSVKGMPKTHCQSVWGGRYCYSRLWKVSSATVLEIFPLEWGPWLNFLSVFFRAITQHLFLIVIFWFKNFIYLFLAMLGLCWCMQVFSSCDKWGLLIMVCRLLIAVASLVVAHGLGCSLACGIFLDQGLNLCPLRWQEDS